MTPKLVDPDKRKFWAQGPAFVTFFDTAAARDAWIAAAPDKRRAESPGIIRAKRRANNRIPHGGGQGHPIVFLE